MKCHLPFSIQNFYKFEGWGPFIIKDPDFVEHLANDNGVDLTFYDRDGLVVAHKYPMMELLSKAGKTAYQELSGLIEFPRLLFVDANYNLVTDEGETELLNRGYNDTTITDAVGLTDGTPTVDETDTMGSHAGWTEVTAYDEADRPALSMGTASSQSIDNSASPASFSINTDSTTIGGAFVSTDNTKGGTAGILIGVAAADGGDKTLGSGDSLDVTITSTAS